MSDRDALVLVTTSYPISGDGSEAAGSFVSDLAEELARHVPVRVVAPGTQSARQPSAEGVEVFRFAAPPRPLSTLKPWLPGDLAAIRSVLVAGETATREAVSAGPTAHIVALWALPSGHWARKVSRETCVPYSLWTLGSDIWTWGRVPLIRTYLRRILKGAHTCYSDGLKLAEDTRRIAGREVGFLPSTRRIERTRTAALKTEPPYRLLFLGRWHPKKGVDLLLEALQMLDEEDWGRIEAVEICGGGPLDGLVKEGVAALQSAGRPVKFRGFLDKTAAEEAIIQADYLLIPSRIESIPVVFSDAMKLQCPVISSPVGDLENIVSNMNCGIVASAATNREFGVAIKAAICSSPQTYKEGVDRVASDFLYDRIVQRLLAGFNIS